MNIVKDERYYLSTFENMLNKNGIYKYKKVTTYYSQIKSDFLRCLSQISEDTLWGNILELVAIDEKLTLLNECLTYMDYYKMSETELIEMVENEYESYNKENCGYSLNDPTPFSLVFPSNFVE